MLFLPLLLLAFIYGMVSLLVAAPLWGIYRLERWMIKHGYAKASVGIVISISLLLFSLFLVEVCEYVWEAWNEPLGSVF